MRLKNLIKPLKILEMKNFKNYEIKSITHISSEVVKNGMFICLKGENFDGNNFVESVVKKGAKCIVTDSLDLIVEGVVILVVENTRIAMSMLAKTFYNNACDNLEIIGVIGTCGKTTTCHMISQILSKTDSKIGNIGTNGIFIGKNRINNNFTTPDPLELHYIFYRMFLLGVKTVVMEVSAQAIALYKMYGIKLKIGVFTNISSEHLDFFKTMENYARVKMDFFSKKHMNECVVNIDDFYGRELAYKVDIPCVSYGINSPANSFAVDINSSMNGLKFVANIMDTIIDVNNKLLGVYNVYNLLAAMSVCKLLGTNNDTISRGVNEIQDIPGRFNLWNKDNKKIIVDFAHTPDSIDKVLANISQICTGKIITVFGCVGYSDKQKRIDMARAVDRYSNYIVITTDNRGKVPFEDIAQDIIIGIDKCVYVCVEDRKSAINVAYGMMGDNDCLVVLGKGAEDYQKIGDDKISYSDIDCVKDLLRS